MDLGALRKSRDEILRIAAKHCGQKVRVFRLVVRCDAARPMLTQPNPFQRARS